MASKQNCSSIIGLCSLVLTVCICGAPAALAADCNGNGIEDSCDISCSNPGCSEIAGCGQEPDCNDNGIPDACDLSVLYVGTQGGTGIGRVYQYLGEVDPLNPANNWQDLTPSPPWNVAAVMDLVIFQGKLYAGVQTEHGKGGWGGEGHVWRLDQTGWVRGAGMLSLCASRGGHRRRGRPPAGPHASPPPEKS